MASKHSVDPSKGKEPAEGTVGPATKKSKGSKALKDVAREVLGGEWGATDQERRQRLAEAGYNPTEVRQEVVRIINDPKK